MTVSLQLSRKFSTTIISMVRHLSKRSNPGIGHQVAALEDTTEVIKNDPEGFGGLESDLMNAHKTHKKHESEIRQQKDKLRQFLVKNKYFRDDPLPNLLTYAEKEQIKILHSRDSEEWTVERLAESFPANREIVLKILRANWKPLSAKRIRSHDASAFENWELFKRGELNQKLANEFREHLKKFADRRSEDLRTLPDPTKTFSKTQWQKPKCTEFSSIVSFRTQDKPKNPKAFSDVVSKRNDSFLLRAPKEDETYLLSKVQNKQQMTINELKESQQTSISNCTSLERTAAMELTNSSGTGVVKSGLATSPVLDYTEKFASNEVIISEHDRKRFEMSAVKDHIHIPRKLWRKGATYRIEDSYYDDDGELLYRVPGMTGS